MRFLFPTYAILIFMKVINLDKEIFEKACSLCEKDFSHEEILQTLANGNDVEKQITILKIKQLKSNEEAELLISHLTGHDGPIREVCAIKLNELITKKECPLIDNKQFYPTFADAICDVNPNISRTIIDFLPILNMQHYMLELLINKIETIFQRIENPDLEQKNFLTVRLFNLYWCLEAIGTLIHNLENFDSKIKLLNFLEKAVKFNNYTIDEKVARILVSSTYKNSNNNIIEELKSSQNFYVRRYFAG